jgi:hypothetical protein
LVLLQRRRVGKSGHAQRISCSSLEGVEEDWKVKRRGGLKEAEAYQSVPSARALVLADVIAHLILLLEAAKL